MKYCIFLCDHQWNIVKIMDSSPTCPLSEGARLPELLANVLQEAAWSLGLRTESNEIKDLIKHTLGEAK